MKRTGRIERRTPLKAKTSLRSRKTKPGSTKRTKTRKSAGPKLKTLKTRLWALCRDITRRRYGNTCYTCGRKGLEGGNWQTGHFLPSSLCSVDLRYELGNLRPQCYHCNINLSGNWPAYEKALKKEMDADYPDFLKRKNEETKALQYDRLYYEGKIAEYEELLGNEQP